MPHLDLDYSAGHISPPLEPTPDDQGLVNDVLATRPDGGEARATLESGPLSVQDPPDGVGQYEHQLDVNVDSDGRLPDIAGWALHHGTWDDPHDRFPLIRTNLRALNRSGFGVLLTGVSGDSATTPDKASLDITGDIDMRVLLWVDEWGQALDNPQDLISKYVIAGSQRSYSLFLDSNSDSEGYPALSWTENGGTTTGLVAIATELPSRTGVVALRGTLDVNNGSGGRTITFYTGPTLDGPWTQLGEQIVQSGTTSIWSGTAPLEVGSRENGTADQFAGVILAARVYDGIGGTLVADPDFAAQGVGTTSFDDSAGNTWTISGDAQIVALDYAAAQTEVGDRLTIRHPPEWLPPDDIDQYVLGYTESIAVDEWTQDWHTTPAGPFNVLAWQDAETTPDPDAPARFDTDGSETVGTFSAGTDTSLEVLTTRGPLWTQDAGDLPFHVRTSGVVLNVTSISGAIRDTFGRTVVNGWGVADSGQQWTLIEGAASDASVGSGVGTLDGVIMGVGSYGDVEVLAKVTPGTGADGSVLARITDQGAGNWAYYEVAVESTESHVGLWIRDDVAEIYDEVAIVEIPIVAGTSYWCRMRVRGHQISLKVWPDGSAEPTSWVPYEDTDETVDEGAVGLAAFFGEVEFDDFAVVNPQRFTVDQAPANGIHKSIPAGSPLRLATPAAFGL